MMRRDDLLTLLALVVLEGLHTGERGGTGNQLVAEVALVLLLAVHLTVSVIGLVWNAVSSGSYSRLYIIAGRLQQVGPCMQYTPGMYRKVGEKGVIIDKCNKKIDLPQPQAIVNICDR